MWLLIGGDSEIAAASLRRARDAGQPALATTRRSDGAGPDRLHLDFSSPLDGWAAPAGVEAACIFAAVARLAACVADPAGSSHVNVTQTVAITERLIKRGIYTLFLSTNQVFDGSTADVPPDAPTAPTSEYGRQKAQAEALLRAHMERGAPIGILRLAKVVSPGMALVHGWLDGLAAGRPVRAFADMTMAPTPIELVTQAISALMRDRATGVFQLTGARDISYFDIGRHLAERVGASPSLVEAGNAAAAGMPPGATPRHTTLDSSRLRDRYGIAMPDPLAVVDGVMTAWRQSQSRLDAGS